MILALELLCMDERNDDIFSLKVDCGQLINLYLAREILEHHMLQ